MRRGMTGAAAVRRWPLALIGAPAAVAVWSGWVGLGSMCGFGLVQPLPGIVSWHLDTAITLPVGVEAYGAYALGAWLTPGTPERARSFARRSAVGALALGMLGQVVYHLLAAAGSVRAPWPVVVLVSCLPVVTLGFGCALTHLLREHAPVPATADADAPAAVPAADAAPQSERTASKGASGSAPKAAAATGRSRNRDAVTDADAEVHFAADLASGEVPSARRIQRELHVGQQRASTLRKHLETLTPAGRSIRRIRDEMRQHADEIRQGAEVASTP